MTFAQAPLTEVAVKRGLVGGPFGSSLVGNDYIANGVPVIRGTNLSPGKVIQGEFVYVSDEKVDRDLSRNIAIPDDIVFTQRGTLGQVAIVPSGEYPKYVISQSQMRLRVDPEIASVQFVYYACSTQLFLKHVLDNAISTGVPHINLGILSRLAIPLPDLEVQRAIAEVLSALDDKIAANTKLVMNASELGGAITRNARKPEICASLSTIAVITMGSSPAGTTFNDVGDGVVFYQGVRDFGIRFPKNRIWTTSSVRLAKAHDCLLSVRAPVGHLNLANEETSIGRGLASVRSRDGRPYTLFHVLNDAPEIWTPFEAEGTVFGSINKAQLESIKVPTVDSVHADQLEAQLAGLEGRISNALAENETIAATRDVLLPQLISGKLRVREAEQVLSAAF